MNSAKNLPLEFGNYQPLVSERLQTRPQLGKWIHRIFGYTVMGNYSRSIIFKDLIKKLPAASFEKVLDLGCGYGEYAFMMGKALPHSRITALDIKTRCISAIRRALLKIDLTNVDTHLGKIETLEEDYYDFIYSVDVFEHIPEAEMPFASCWEKLRPGGYLLVKIPSRTQKTLFPEGWFEEHHDWLEDEHVGQVYELEDLRARFEAEGFEVVHASYSDGFLSRVAWEWAYLCRKMGQAMYLLNLPICKALVHLDKFINGSKSGNAIQVIGKKPE